MEYRQHLTYRLVELLLPGQQPRPPPLPTTLTDITTLANILGHHPDQQPRPPPWPTTLATTLANNLGHHLGQQPWPPPWPTTSAANSAATPADTSAGNRFSLHIIEGFFARPGHVSTNVLWTSCYAEVLGEPCGVPVQDPCL